MQAFSNLGLAIRLGWRTLRRRPRPTLGTVAVLAAGVGLSTMLFGAAVALQFRPLAVSAAHRLVFVSWQGALGPSPLREAELKTLESNLPTGYLLTAQARDVAVMQVSEHSTRLVGERVAPDYFDVLRALPIRGRTFRQADDRAFPGEIPLVISGRLWRRAFASNPAIAGTRVEVDRAPYIVVGVMPERFAGTLGPWMAADYWVPVGARARHLLARRPRYRPEQFTSMMGILRLTGDSSVETVRPVLATIGDHMHESRGGIPAPAILAVRTAPWAPVPFGQRDGLTTDRLAGALIVVALVVLVVAAGNLSFVLAAQTTAREPEYAVKLALGSSRSLLVQQGLSESLILGLIGGTVGLGLAAAGLRAAVAAIPAEINGQPLSVDLSVDTTVVSFALGAGVIAGLVAGAMPALHVIWFGRHSALRPRGQARRAIALVRCVVVPQIAMTLVLLLPAAVLLKTTWVSERAPLGFSPGGRVFLRYDFDAAESTPGGDVSRQDRERRLRTRLPVVGDAAWRGRVALTSALPWDKQRGWFLTAGERDSSRYENLLTADVSAWYFSVMGVPLVRGRSFDERDAEASTPVVIVSESFARQHWPDRDPLTQRVALHDPDSVQAPRWCDVVGVVGDVRHPLLGADAVVSVYRALGQGGVGTAVVAWPAHASMASIDQVSAALRRVDPDVVTYRGGGLVDAAVDGLRAPRRFGFAILGSAGAAALWLALAGLYGAVALATRRRRLETAIRMAIGAAPADIVRLLAVEGVAVVAFGIAGGTALALGISRLVAGIAPAGILAHFGTLVSMLFLVFLVSLLACVLPALKVAFASPIVALRQE